MTDTLTKAKRSWNMSRIKSTNTKPEIIVRSALHKAGFRFRLYKKGLPCKPDIILPKHKTVIFVHGYFWHRHKRCKYAYNPKSRITFWKNKFVENTIRDRKNYRGLKKTGWKVIVIWECELNNLKNIERKLRRYLQ
jgi:DNA mismatch endonuclease (patch repair protein)